MKKTLFLLIGVLVCFSAKAQQISITKAQGSFESAIIEWQTDNAPDSYNVYYSGGGLTNKIIDGQLIRDYGTYFRADIPGLKAGNYTINIVPVNSGIEGESVTSNTVTVMAHDRSGFAFSNDRIPGAYKADGTPKDNAVVLYISENTKDTISLEVTGANSNPCVGLQTILEGFKKGKDTRPLIVRVIGQITDLSYMTKGDIVIENSNNESSYITLEGIGNDAVAYGWGIRLKNACNVEIRNIGTMNCDSDEGDNIGLQQNNQYIWVHHCDFFYGEPGGDSDQAKGDGTLDCKKSTYVTFSYNHFWDTGKSNLLGLSEGTTEGLYITYHHNWYDHSDSRHPRVRYYSAHVYNNYYDGNAKYGIGSTKGSSVFVEGNYFRNCKYPILTSMQGTDVYDESTGSNDYSDKPTFSKEDGGSIKAYNNYMTGQRRFVPYGDSSYPNSTVDFDAYVASSRNETLSSSVISYKGSNTYNNFDTNSSIMYSYSADTPEQAKENVINYAGRVEGGDFTWTFDNSEDDTSYDINSGLKSALDSYTTSLVAIQDDGSIGGDTGSGGDDDEDEGSIILTAAANDGYVDLNWTVQNIDISGMEVYRDTDSDPSGSSKIATVSSNSYTDSDVSNETTYYYWIKITDQDSSVITSNVAYATPQSGSSEENSEDVVHNFTESGKTSSFFTISGNLSTSKGTVTYNGLTLTQCLKIESSTNISFTTTQESTLTLVFNDSFSEGIKIDGTSYDASNGVLTLNISAGSHTITKGDVANLYYISIAYVSTESTPEDETEEGSIVLTASAGDGYVDLSWSVQNIDISDMEVYRDTDSDPSGSSKIATVSSNSYTDSEVSNEITYYYWIKITDQDSSVITSNIAYATPQSDSSEENSEEVVHNFTESGKTSSFFSISGNLSTSKGTVTYNGLTLTQCLKIESSTNVSFTTTQESTLTLVFNDSFSGRIKIDGTSYDVSNGVLTLNISAGSHTITKGDVANLYYISIAYVSAQSTLKAAEFSTEKVKAIKVYPNPVTDNLNVVSDYKVKLVEVYNITGIKVLEAIPNVNIVNVSSLTKGLYVIKVTTENGIYKQTIIVI